MAEATHKPPKTYEIIHLAKKLDDDGDLDKFVVALCDEISEVVENRKDTFEKEWAICEENYYAAGNRKDRGDQDAQLDFTITFEICRQAESNLANPVFAQDQVFVAKGRPGYLEMAAAHDIFLDWMADRAEYDTIVSDSLRTSQIFTKAVCKAGWSYRERKVKYWDEDENGAPIEQEKTIIEDEGCFPFIVDTRRIYHPIPSASVEDARWICEKFETTPGKIKIEQDKGYYREDLDPMAVGEARQDPDGEVGEAEVFVANIITPKATKTELSELVLMECYTVYKGEEIVLILDLPQKTWLAAHSSFFQDFPRPYSTFSWHPTLASMDGKSLCSVLDQLHRAYVAIMNVLLDAGVRGIEPLLISLKRMKLSEMLDNGRLGPGLMEVEEAMIDDLRKGIMEIRLASGDITFLLTLLDRIVKHMHDAASIPPAFMGEEFAQRPTATGTTAILERAMQPLFEMMNRYRKFLARVVQMQYARYRQYNPQSMQFFIDAQDEETAAMLKSMTIEFPPGYWKDQIVIETKVNSQTMSKSIKKQEILAMVDKLPQIFQGAAEMASVAVEGGPLAPLAGNFLDVYDLVLNEFLAEFEMPEVRNELDIDGSKMAGEAIQNTINSLTQIIQQLQQRIVDDEAQLVDIGGEVSEEPPAGMELGGDGQPQEASGVGGGN